MGREIQSPYHTLGAHVKAIDPLELWNSIQTRRKIYKQNTTALGHGPSNSTTIDANAPLMTTPTSPIIDHHAEVNQHEDSSMGTVKELLEDPHILPGMMTFTLSAVTSLFTPSKLTPSTDNSDPLITNKVPVGSTHNNTVTPDLNEELNVHKDRLTLELSSFKKQLKSEIEVECAKKHLKSEFDLEL